MNLSPHPSRQIRIEPQSQRELALGLGVLFLAASQLGFAAAAEPSTAAPLSVKPVMTMVAPQLDPSGALAKQLERLETGRLTNLPNASEKSPTTSMTDLEFKWFRDSWTHMVAIYRERPLKNEWSNEHLPKYLIALALAAKRTGNPSIRELALACGDQLVATQDAEGYIGAYPIDKRMQNWDAWGVNYTIQALMRLHELDPSRKYDRAAAQAAEYMAAFKAKLSGDFRKNWQTGAQNGSSVQWFMGTASLIPQALRGPETVKAIDGLYANFVRNEEPDPKGVKATQSGYGAKYYEETQMAWAGLLAGRSRDDDTKARIRAMVFEQKMRDSHCSPTGAVWGDSEHASLTPASLFYRMEICGQLAWSRLQQELLAITGNAQYAENLERLLCNQGLASMQENGYYFSGDDGHTLITHRPEHGAYRGSCCVSSGPVLLEELPLAAGGTIEGAFAINLFLPGLLAIPGKGSAAAIEISGDLTTTGACRLRVAGAVAQDLLVRVPTWLEKAEIRRGDQVVSPPHERGYWRIAGPFKPEEVIALRGELPMRIVAQPWSGVPDGALKERGVLSDKMLVPLTAGGYLRRGPVVYGWFVPRPEFNLDGKNPQREHKQDFWDGITGAELPTTDVLDVKPITAPAPYAGPAFSWTTPGGEAILLPYWQVVAHGKDGVRVLLKRQGDATVPLPAPIPTPTGGRGPLTVDMMEERPFGAPRPEHVGAWVTFTLDGRDPDRDGLKWAGSVTVNPGQTLKVQRFTATLASEIRSVSPLR